MEVELLRLNGNEARKYVNELAELRLRVFWEYPYLYEGSLEYEKNYLETYFKAQHSFILLMKAGGQFIGATTGIWAEEEEESFRKPFLEHGLDPRKVFYFGESVLLPEWRGKGLGKIFYRERETFARSLDFIEWLSFCSVVREDSHSLRPLDYQSLDSMWENLGFSLAKGMTTVYEWNDRGDTVTTPKLMQFWLKRLERNHDKDRDAH